MRTIKQFFNLKAAYRSDFKSFLRSIVALLLVVMLVFCSTYAWIEGAKNAEAKGEECTVIAGSGVKFIGPDATNPTSVSLPNKTTLSDCSSVDGRNIFIPTTGSIRKSSETTSTSNLKFRNAVEEDKNNKFLTAEFSIKSLENKSDDTSKTTPIYIDSSSSFTCASGSSLPFRVSLNFNDGSDPVVLCPGLTYETATRQYTPVSSINADTGAAKTASKTADSMQKYFYGKTPVYSLPYGETRKVTVTLWLEGTDSDCTAAKVSAQSIGMNLVLTTEDLNMRTITFVDYTPTSWVADNSAAMFVVDETNSSASYKMTKASDGITYTARIPNSVTNIYFQRTVNDPDVPGEINNYNVWSNGMEEDLDTTTTYHAIGRGQGTASTAVDDKCYGYWADACKGMIKVYYRDIHTSDSDGEGILAHSAGSEPYIYIFDGESKTIKAWNGFRMEKVDGTNDDYYFYAPADAKLVFNDGKSSNPIQSVDVDSSDYYTINTSSGVTEVKFTFTGSKADNGKYYVKTY